MIHRAEGPGFAQGSVEAALAPRPSRHLTSSAYSGTSSVTWVCCGRASSAVSGGSSKTAGWHGTTFAGLSSGSSKLYRA